MRKTFVILVLALATAWMPACKSTKTGTAQVEAAAPRAATPVPFDPETRTGVLENGLRYYVRPNAKPENYAELRLAVNAGSILENDDQQGLAHFLEHMCFNGTTHFPKSALVDYLESIGTRFGAHLNAYTSFDETVYMLRVPTNDAAKLQTGLQILEDWAHEVSFDGVEIEKERGVVIEEWRTRLGAGNRLNQKTFPKIFYNARYASRLAIGQKEILETFSHETLKQFYRDWYRPDLMAVVAVGDFDPDSMEQLIRKQFGAIPKAQAPKPRTVYPVPDHAETIVAIESDPEATSNLVRLIYKHDTRPQASTQDYRRSLLSDLCSQMLNARLSELAQKENPPFRAAFSGYGSLARDKDNYSCAAIVPENGMLKGLETLLVENERAVRHGFTASELERAKRSLVSGLEQEMKEKDKTESQRIVMNYVYHFLEGAPAPGIDNSYRLAQEMLPGVSLAEVNAEMRSYIRPDNRVVIITGAQKATQTFPTEAEVRALLEKAPTMDIQPYQDDASDAPLMAQKPKAAKITSEKTLASIGVTELTFENGLKVVLKPTAFQNDRILLRAFSPGGHSLYSDEQYMSASRAAEIVDLSGIGPFNNVQLEKYLSDKVVGVGPYINELSEGFNGESSVKDFETMLQMVNLYFTAPRKDEQAFASWQNRTRSALANAGASPENWFRNEANKKLYNNHFRRDFIPAPEKMEQVKLDAAYQIFRDRFADAGDFTFVLTGSFDVEQIKPLLATYLGSLPSTGRKESWKDVGAPIPSAMTETFRKGTEPKSQVILQFNGPFEWTPQNRFMLNNALQVLNIMMRESMREEKGGVYGVGANASSQRDPRSRYAVNITFTCSPDNAESLIQTALTDAANLVKDGPSEKNLQKIKEIQLKELEVNVQENDWWIEQLAFSYQYGGDPEALLNLKSKIEAVTAADVQAAAKRYFDPARLARMVLLPEM